MGYRINISATGVVLYGFLGWRIFHYLLLALCCALLLLSLLRLYSLAAKTSYAISLLMVVAIPLTIITSLSSSVGGFSLMLLMLICAIFSIMITLFYWIGDSFSYRCKETVTVAH